MIIAFVIYPIAGLIAAIIADRLALAKNRNRVFWMSVSLFLPPFAILLYFLKKRPWNNRPKYNYDDNDDDL